jgi:hypothetical protein
MNAPLSIAAILAKLTRDASGNNIIGTPCEWQALHLATKQHEVSVCSNQEAFDSLRQLLQSWNYSVTDDEALTSKLMVTLDWPAMVLKWPAMANRGSSPNKNDFMYFLSHILMDALEIAVKNDYVGFTELMTLWWTNKDIRSWCIGIRVDYRGASIRIPSIEFCEKLITAMTGGRTLRLPPMKELHELAALLASYNYTDEALFVIQSIRGGSVRCDPRFLVEVAMANGSAAFAEKLLAITTRAEVFKILLLRGIRISFHSAELYNKNNIWKCLTSPVGLRFILANSMKLPLRAVQFLFSAVQCRSPVAFDYINSKMAENLSWATPDYTLLVTLQQARKQHFKLELLGHKNVFTLYDLHQLAHEWGYPPACDLADRIMAD